MIGDIKKRLIEAERVWNAHAYNEVTGACPYGCKGGSLAAASGCAKGAALEDAVEGLRGQFRDELRRLGR